MNRREDLTRVFDKTWNANHNDDIKNARTREKEFMDRMYNVRKTSPIDQPQNKNFVPPKDNTGNMQNNINSMATFQRHNTVNNIVKKWK